MPERVQPRRWTHDGFIPFRLEILTPVFVGSGEDLSPLDYVIREEKGTYALHLVDTKAWLLTAQDKSDIGAALAQGDILRLRRLMHDQLDTALFSLGRIPIAQPGTAEELLKHINNPRSLSNAEIQPFIRTPSTMAAFLPGSSLKGALSTPLIDSLDQGRLKAAASRDKWGYTKTLEAMLGRISEHSMQALKVADIPIAATGTEIVSAVEVRREAGKNGTPKPPCEVIAPEASKQLPLYGRLFMDSTGGKPHITLPQGKVISLEDLGNLSCAFYRERFQNEIAKFYKLPHLATVGRTLAPLQKRVDALNPEREILLRVGHYSHVESVTVTANAPNAKKGFGKTRTLANHKLPFGWVILCLCPMEEYVEGLRKVEATINAAQDHREEIRLTREKDLRKALDEQRKRAEAAALAKAKAEEEKKRKEQEAAEREAKFAALSPEERAIAEVAAADSTEAQSMALFAKLDSLSPDLQAKAAEALRDCWKRLGKWDGKLSQKQKKKVTAVKAFLP